MINDPISLANPVCTVPWCDKTCTWNIGDKQAVTEAAVDGILSREHRRVWSSGVALSLFEAPCTDTAPRPTYVMLPYPPEFAIDGAWSDMGLLEAMLVDAKAACDLLVDLGVEAAIERMGAAR